ncbi:hypothetical protein TNIN_22881 [Trichonephila inaurata madagascariensis]|uniref:Uncharacterized protein n=1 Tax=Trichonephila inaurata madagascariensis TaxID=2747483 RepID=A0A8X7BXV8_9ARAC|nr:hypothetical protein TNIN_22881 [Trichonephila inaurata madagascariensis]
MCIRCIVVRALMSEHQMRLNLMDSKDSYQTRMKLFQGLPNSWENSCDTIDVGYNKRFYHGRGNNTIIEYGALFA